LAVLQVPLFLRDKDSTAAVGSGSLGPFTPAAEMLNGRVAMIGFATLLIIEGIRGVPLF
jgi:hypothetical protein